MSTGLKGQLGLGEPAPTTASDQAEKFKAEFQAAMDPINSDLQYTAAHAPQAKHDGMAAKRDTAFKAYQAALAKVNPTDPKVAQGAIDQVLTAVKALAPAVSTLKQDTEKWFTEWERRQPEVDTNADKVREMNEWGHPKAAPLQAVVDAIKSKGNAREYEEALQALDQLLAKAQPIIDDYEKQRAAQAEYEPALAQLQPRLDGIASVGFKAIETAKKEIAAAATKMSDAATAKEFVTALEHLKALEQQVTAAEASKTEIEGKQQKYAQALDALKPRLAAAAESKYEKLATMQQDIVAVQGQMETAATDEQFDEALTLSGNLTVKLDAFATSLTELEQQKQAYETKSDGLKPKLDESAKSDFKKLEPLKAEVTTAQSEMEAAAAKSDFEQAGQLADQLGTKLDTLETTRAEIEKQKQAYNAEITKLQPRLAEVNQTDNNANIAPLQKEIATAQSEMETAASNQEFEQAQTLAKSLSTMLDSYKNTEAGQVYEITYNGQKYYGSAEELAVLKMKIAAAVIKDGFPPLKNRAEMNQGWYNELKSVRDEYVIIGAVVNALGGASLDSIATALAAQEPALDAASTAISADLQTAEEPYRKAVEAVNATGQAITVYLAALETGGNRTITALQVVEVVCFAIGAAAGAAVLAPAGAGLAATAGANAAAGAGFGVLQSLAENGAHNLIMTGEKPISPGEIVTNAAISAITNGVGAALGTVAGKKLGAMVIEKLVVKLGFQTQVMKLVVQDCVEGSIGNTVQTVVSGSPDLVRGKTTWDKFAIAVVEGFVAGGIAAGIAGKMNRNSPLFKNLTDDEINAAFREAEAGTKFQLPAQNPKTGEGLKSIKTKFDADKPIPHHDNMNFTGIKDAPKGKAEVRRHSANPNAPEGSFSHDNPTTQVNSGKKYMLPDGTWKNISDMTPDERAACHIP